MTQKIFCLLLKQSLSFAFQLLCDVLSNLTVLRILISTVTHSYCANFSNKKVIAPPSEVQRCPYLYGCTFHLFNFPILTVNALSYLSYSVLSFAHETKEGCILKEKLLVEIKVHFVERRMECSGCCVLGTN